MSQLSSIILGSSPFVGPVLTLTGDAGGPVGPTVGGTINLLSSNTSTITIIGNPGTNTLTFSLSNQLVGEVTTVDNTPTNVPGLLVTMLPQNGVNITTNFVAVIDDYSAIRTGVSAVAARRPAIGATVIDSPVVNYTSNKTPGFFPKVTYQLVGNDVSFTVIGEPATTIKWTALLTFLFV